MIDSRHCAAPLVGLMLLVAGSVMAQGGDDTPLRGRDRAIEAVTTNLQRQVDHLTALLDRVPEQARPGIEQAIESLRLGMEKALAALEVAGGEEQPGDPREAVSPEGEDVAETVTAHERALQAITEGTAHAETALGEAMGEVPEKARSALEKALERIVAARERALGAQDRPERAGRPEQVERPERPSRPEQAEVPSRPERPERPERRDG